MLETLRRRLAWLVIGILVLISAGLIASTSADKNALLVTGENVTVTDSKLVRESADSTGGDSASFYGVGAAAVMDGKLVRGKHFQAACIGGHMVIEFGPDATPCNCGNIGCMEANASSWALPIFAHKDSLFETSMLKDLDVIDYKNLKACADKGDELSVKLLRRSLDCGSANLCNLIIAYDPEVIILSGGIARMGEDLRRPLEEHVHKYAWTPWGHPDIRLAEKPEASVVLGLHKLTLDEIAGKTAL